MKKILSLILALAMVLCTLLSSVITIGAETKINDSDDGYIHPVTLKNGEVDKTIVDGEVIYAMKAWACPSMVFNYELEAGKEYVFEFEYRGHNWAQNCVPSIMAAPNLDFQLSATLPQYRISLGVASTKDAFTKFEVVFKAESLLAGGGKYFTLFAQNLRDLGEFKNMKLTALEEITLLQNPGFEDGLNGWSSNSNKHKVTEDANNGDYALQLPVDGSYTRIWQSVEVEENTDYQISFWYKGTTWMRWVVCDGTNDGTEGFVPAFDGGTGFITGESKSGNAPSWTQITVTVNSGSYKKLALAFMHNINWNIKIDDCVIRKSIKDTAIIKNGSFEEGTSNWWTTGSFTTANVAYAGISALKIHNGSYDKIGQLFEVKAGKKYVLMFNHIGNMQWSKWAVTSGGEANKKNIENGSEGFVIGGVLGSSDTWKTVVSQAFVPETDDTYCVKFQTHIGNTGDCYIDDVMVFEYDDSGLFIESEHDYKEETDQTWVITRENTANIKITFSAETFVEKDWDFIYIYDGEDSEIGKYTSSELASKSVTISGDTAKIRLVSDRINNAYGFRITDVDFTCAYEYDVEITEPTCTEYGYKIYTCPHCGDTYSEKYLPPFSHSYTSKITSPTCTEQGYTTYTCKKCGDSYVFNCVSALGHSETAVITTPTCAEQGYTTYTCTVCGEVRKGDYVSATGVHIYENGKCVSCGEYLESEHDYENLLDETWVISRENAKNITITFSAKTNVEKNRDYIYIYDGEDKEIGKYTGDELASESVTVSGDTAKIRLVTDRIGTAYGFKITDISAEYSNDINGDGKLDSADVILMKKAILGLTEEIETYDLNGDGKINILDLIRIKKLLANI